ncbi:MAG TPA: UDP-N-acetylmuramoyl-tripeptide--D-alanyl-D-alanine ligase [Geobacteraceae bacterium]|nr:UDP-N-acetylmuramoyl-tripeptide--D-alanyl-D-alanine ligase [Geobacteraceae bacterium]
MFTVEEIARATGGEIIGAGGGEVAGVSTDSRTVGNTELFVPLRGERFDGHDFIGAAVSRGVRVFLVEKEWVVRQGMPAGASCITVADTLRGLGDLAAFHRGRFALPMVAVTGSNGKTTTKEMIAAILATTGPGLKTGGNLNNLVGLPLTLFRLSRQDRWAVLEMGMSEPGEIDRLAEIARPDVGVITNAFPAHLESMGSVEAVARAKGELFLRLSAGGWAVYNADDHLISACPSPHGVLRLGFGLKAGEIGAAEIKTEGKRGVSFTIRLPGGEMPVRMKAYGLHNVANALAAAAAATALGLGPDAIRQGLEMFTPYEKRFNLEEVGGIVLIDDSYNANPASMEAALRTVAGIREECRAVAVLGDMLELGPGSEQAHRAIGSLAASCVERLYLLGDMAGAVAMGAIEGGLPASAVIVAGSHEEIAADLQENLIEGDVVLVKGSRGMRMEVVAEGLRRRVRECAKGAVA